MTRRIKHPTTRNPIALAVARAQARKAFDALKTDAGLHAHIGANRNATIATAGRWLWVVAQAALARGLTVRTCPDLNIVEGASSAVGDLYLNNDPLDRHRAAIVSGLAAAQRLEAVLTTQELMAAALELDRQLVEFNRGWE